MKNAFELHGEAVFLIGEAVIISSPVEAIAARPARTPQHLESFVRAALKVGLIACGAECVCRTTGIHCSGKGFIMKKIIVALTALCFAAGAFAASTVTDTAAAPAKSHKKATKHHKAKAPKAAAKTEGAN
ncbi:hypothetical protein [Niveibacterium sp. SC-1]|uniref:hypothetical protein n=1 Tax=Niveibacterium sp. SC-1 TaxID=3135646 RepID=UPI00311D5C56